MAEEYVEENCGELDLMSEVCIEGCGKARAKLCPIQKADMHAATSIDPNVLIDADLRFFRNRGTVGLME